MIAASISSAGAGLGQAAERHLDLSFRALASNAECSSEGFMRIMTGEPHPLANFAVVPPDSDAACVEIATEPLELKVPSAVIIAGPASPEIDSSLTKRGFVHVGSMPAMAVDIATLRAAALPRAIRWSVSATQKPPASGRTPSHEATSCP
ncbi:MAG: hypothetical protein R2724_00670 [Bryobacterales bacterium]